MLEEKKMSSDIRHIVAYRARDGGIGGNNKLLYRLPRDMWNFKLQTRNQIVLMGRKTWESIGKKPLPDRINVVLSRSLTPQECPLGMQVCSTLIDALEWCRTHHPTLIVYVIGGAELYHQTLYLVKQVWATEIEDDDLDMMPIADTFYPISELEHDFVARDPFVLSDIDLDKLSGRHLNYSIWVFNRVHPVEFVTKTTKP